MTQPEIHVHIHNDNCGDQALAARVTALEATTMTLADDINASNAVLTELAEDTAARLAALEAAVADGTPEAQAAVAALQSTLAPLVALVGDADADGNPAPSTP